MRDLKLARLAKKIETTVTEEVAFLDDLVDKMAEYLTIAEKKTQKMKDVESLLLLHLAGLTEVYGRGIRAKLLELRELKHIHEKMQEAFGATSTRLAAEWKRIGKNIAHS